MNNYNSLNFYTYFSNLLTKDILLFISHFCLSVIGECNECLEIGVATATDKLGTYISIRIQSNGPMDIGLASTGVE